jgi:hypothetical protein
MDESQVSSDNKKALAWSGKCFLFRNKSHSIQAKANNTLGVPRDSEEGCGRSLVGK